MPEGRFTVDATGGRVGGLLKEPAVRVTEPVAAGLEAVVEVVPGRRTVDDVLVLPGRFTAGATSGLEPLVVDLAPEDLVAEDLVDLGDSGDSASVPAVPAVSSPERTDSSFWTTSKPSVSDMFNSYFSFPSEIWKLALAEVISGYFVQPTNVATRNS